MTFIIISVAGLAWLHLNIYHTGDECKINMGSVEPPAETQKIIHSINDVYSNFNRCKGAELKKKFPEQFLPVQGVTLTWKYGSELYWARKCSFPVTALLQFLLHLIRMKNICSSKKSQEHTAWGKTSLRGVAV